ncbi:MAG: LysM peptidoglycan-binding domain-containing protein [Eubacteriales bacterium]|nr:LysM peptidoglycan-binding domain-containing protein [Eubacteriales bacterium]
MQKFYIDGVLLPITPGQLVTQIVNKNKTVQLANGEEYNLTEKPGLTEFSFSFWLPFDANSPLSINRIPQEEMLQKLSNLKSKANPFLFQVLNTERTGNVNQYVTLEEYKVDESAENGKDILIDITLKAWNPLKTQRVEVEAGKVKVVKQEAGTKGINKELPKNQELKTYTVKKGDTLSLIAKRYLGNSSKWRELYQRNRESITNPNKIKVGQVIKLEG